MEIKKLQLNDKVYYCSETVGELPCSIYALSNPYPNKEARFNDKMTADIFVGDGMFTATEEELRGIPIYSKFLILNDFIQDETNKNKWVYKNEDAQWMEKDKDNLGSPLIIEMEEDISFWYCHISTFDCDIHCKPCDVDELQRAIRQCGTEECIDFADKFKVVGRYF